jgi:hypothetical protein
MRFTAGVPGDFALILSFYSPPIQLSLIKIVIMNAAQRGPASRWKKHL